MEVINSQFRKSDLQAFLASSFITPSSTRGMKRKWHFKPVSSMNLEQYPRKKDLNLSINSFLNHPNKQSQTHIDNSLMISSADSQRVDESQLEENLFLMINDYLRRYLPNESSKEKRCEMLLRQAKRYATENNYTEVAIAQSLQEYHCPNDKMKEIITPIISRYFNKEARQWVQSLEENPIQARQRLNKISSLRESMTMLNQRVKEYEEVVELLSAGILKPDTHFIFWRDEKVGQCFQDLSVYDIERIQFQLFCCEKVFRRLLKMTRMKWNKVSELLTNMESQSNYMIDFLMKEYDSWLYQYKDRFTMPKIVDEALEEILPVSSRPTSRTLTSWVNELKKEKYKGWNLSCRGHHKRKDRFDDISIGDESIHDRFKRYLATENQISPKKSRQWLEQLIQEKTMPGHPARNIAISMRWVRKWMKHYGAQFLERKKSYYSDNHESESTLYYRKHIYLPQQNTLSLRQPMWVEIPLKEVISAQLDDSVKRTGCTEQRVWKRGEELFTKIHIDFLDVESHSKYRKSCLENIGDPGKYYYDTDQNGKLILPEKECLYAHGQNCKCHCKILKLGHDEKIWFSESQNRSAWTMTGSPSPPPKNKGIGVMTSAFVDPYRGLGLPLSVQELNKVNRFRQSKGRSILKKSPGLTFFRYGVHKDGYWNYKSFYEQLLDVLDVIEVIYPAYQLVLEVDQSSGHMKYEDDALITTRMNVGWGGSQSLMRDTHISSQDFLGHHSPRIKVGDTQKMYFDEQSPGPFYEQDAETIKFDRSFTPMELAEMQSRCRPGKPTTKKGWLNQPKGMKQILWERGLYVNGMSRHQMQQTLTKCPDFENEKIGIQKLLESRGHILIISPKCHPELAGSGIEYAWGMADLIFRKVEGKDSKNVERHIEYVLGKEVLTLERIWKYERKTRDYMRLYGKISEMQASESPKYHEIEEMRKMEKKYRSHRHILDTNRQFIEKS